MIKSLILATEATRNGLNYPIIFPSLEHKIWHMKSFKFVRKNLSKSFKHFVTWRKNLVFLKENVSHHISLSTYFIRTEKVLISQNDGKFFWCMTMMLENIFFSFARKYIWKKIQWPFQLFKISSRLVERGICLVLQLAFCYVAMIVSHFELREWSNFGKKIPTWRCVCARACAFEQNIIFNFIIQDYRRKKIFVWFCNFPFYNAAMILSHFNRENKHYLRERYSYLGLFYSL